MPKISKYSRGKLEQIIRTRSVQGDVAAAIGGGGGGGDLSVNGSLATTGSVLVSTSDGKVQGTELNINSLNNISGIRDLTASFGLISNDLTVNGSLSATTASFTGGITIEGAESTPADLIFKADEGDDAGDEWRLRAGTDTTLVFGNDRASAGTYASLLTLTGHSTTALSKAQFAGQVGIGKVPGYSLDIQGGAVVSSYVGVGTKIGYHSGDEFPSAGGTIFFSENDTRIYGGGIRGVDVNQYKVAVNLANSDVDFEICGNSNDALLWADADDECIGIHENDPMNALHIAHKGADKNDGLIIVRTNYNNAGGYNSLTISNSDYLGGIGFDSQDGNIPSSILEASAFIAAYAAEDHSTGDKGGDLVFGTTAIDDDDDTVSHAKMRIRSNGEIVVQNNIVASGTISAGDLGIGTSSPIAKLDVAGKIAITSESSTPAQPADGKGFLYTKAGGGLFWRSYDLAETNVLEGGLQAAGALATTGSVLVSTGAGEVQGTELNIDSSNNLTLPVGSKAKAEAFQTYSSARYKENVCVIEDPIEKLSKLKGVYFDWIGREESRDIGFIAEEVGRVLPEIVTYESDNTNAISMSYDKIVPLLVEAVNESREREKKNKKIFWAVTILNLALVSLGTIFL